MHSCCMVESQVPGQCCGLGCCPANKCLTRVTTLFKQENDKETHLKTRRTETQCKNPPQSNAPCGLGPVQDLRGVAVGVRAPQHRHTIRISSDAQSERFLDAQWLGSRLRGVNMASINSLSNWSFGLAQQIEAKELSFYKRNRNFEVINLDLESGVNYNCDICGMLMQKQSIQVS